MFSEYMEAFRQELHMNENFYVNKQRISVSNILKGFSKSCIFTKPCTMKMKYARMPKRVNPEINKWPLLSEIQFSPSGTILHSGPLLI